MSSLWITNARVIDPVAKRDARGDLFIADGRFGAGFSAEQKKQARKIDAHGLVANERPPIAMGGLFSPA